MKSLHNNQELFSNYYLNERLPKRDVWKTPEGLKETYNKISELFESKQDILEAIKESQTEEEWIKPILHLLGFEYIPQPSRSIFDTTKVPDYAFFLNEEDKKEAFKAEGEALFEHAVAIGDAKRWGLNLNQLRPNKQIDEYLRITNTAWGILTNGQLWRIYHIDSSYRLDVYYEVNLIDLIKAKNPEKFKYFYFFFHSNSFVEAGFLEEVYEKSEDYTVAVSQDLKKNVFDALREICQGFLDGNHNLQEEDLDQIHENALILLYRIIFLLYAESDEKEKLMPMDNTTYRNTYSLKALKREVIEKIQNNESILTSSHTYWNRLKDLFSFVDKGEETLRVYEYNGGLFDSEKHQFLDEKNEICDKYIAEAIYQVSYSKSETGFIDYQDLDVRELGAIYESLLEHKPVIEEGKVQWKEDLSERKKTGSYYTPEYIVKYIVENTVEPLIEEKGEEIEDEIQVLREKVKRSRGYNRGQYQKQLQQKKTNLREEILDLKILDPAMGSGHFLVETTETIATSIARLEEKFSVGEEENQDPEGETEEDPVKELKRQIVERSIYGVDKNPLATELAKLSLWLHTVAKGEPLSFLDHHLRTGDSLIGIDIDGMKQLPSQREDMAGLFESRMIQDLSKAIGHLIMIEEFTSESREDIQTKKKKWRDVKAWIDKYRQAANLHLSTYFGNEVSNQQYMKVLRAAANNNIEKVEDQPYFKQAQKIAEEKRFFHWELEFLDVFRTKLGKKKEQPGFDVVIGNPPYVQLQKNHGTQADLYKDQDYKTFTRRGDIYCLFYERGLQIAKKETGLLCYITSNKWMRAKYGKKLRKFLASNNPLKLINFGGYKVFQEQTVDTNILVVQNKNNGNALEATKVGDDFASDTNIPDFFRENKVTLTDLSKDTWFIGSKVEMRLKEKIEKIGTPLKDWGVNINYGIKTGYNNAFIIDKEKRNELINKDPKSEEIIKPILRGRDIKRYGCEFAGKYLLFIPWHFPLHKNGSISGSSQEAAQEFQKQYPAVFKHLLKHKERLSKRNQSETGIRYEWYALQRCAATYYEEFEKEKIVWGNISYNSRFCFVEGGTYINAPANILTSNKANIRYLLACMNSKIFDWEFGTQGIDLGRGFEWKKQYVEKVHIPQITPQNKDSAEKTENLVDEILKKKKQNPDADTKDLEAQIDQLVYKLYNLTSEEIEIVERNTKQ